MAATSQAHNIGSEQGKDERHLRNLAGVGPAVERDLRMLNVQTVAELAACDGDELYRRLCEITGTRQDPCVLDTLRCAVAQARDARLPAEQRNWWWWSRQRKQGRLS
jgi:hypothetical protein